MTAFRAFVTNMGEYAKGNLVGEWIDFPCTDEDWEKALKRIGVGENSEYFFTDYESEIAGLTKELGEVENYQDLQGLAEKLEDLESWERDIFEASLKAESCSCASACSWRIDTLGEWLLYEDVNSDYDLGVFYAEEDRTLNSIPKNLQGYFDFEGYGRDISIGEGGTFTSKGYVVRRQ